MERKILVVDDEMSVRDLFEDALGGTGYRVYTAESAEQALAILHEENIDVIFLDLKLFGMNGIELCRKIRKFKPVSLIYAITGWSTLFEVEECREAGFDDLFTKPVKLDVLFKAVEDAFEKINRWKNQYGTVGNVQENS
jgi:DNA-binding response OmpR family regulator